MKTGEETLRIIEVLKELYPDALCSLTYQKDYELLFAVRLSAQCTDARVNLVTPELFSRIDRRRIYIYGYSAGAVGLLELLKLIKRHQTIPATELSIGFLVSFIVGLFALYWVINWIKKGKLNWFAYWLFLMAAFSFCLAMI